MYHTIYKYRFWISSGILLILATCFLGALIKKTGIIDFQQNNEDIVSSRAREFYLNGDYVEATDLYEKMIVLNPDVHENYLDLAIIYDDYIGNRERAIDLYRKYLELEPASEKRELIEEWVQQAEKNMLGVPREGNKAIGERLLILQQEMDILSGEKQKLEHEVERLSGTLYTIQAEHQKELDGFQKQRQKLSAEISSSRVRINKLLKELEKTEKSRQKLQKKIKEFQENEYYFGDIKNRNKAKDSKNKNDN